MEAGEEKTEESKPKRLNVGSKKYEEFLKTAMKRLKKCVDADEHNRTNGIMCLKFLNGEQWDAKEKDKRGKKGRPCLVVNHLPKYVDQVCGDARHNRPAIKIRPVGDRADIQIAKIRQGLISNIEYLSNAGAVYDQALEMAVSCGFGAWRILTRYCDDNPFAQEIYLEAVPNPFLVYKDPSCKDAVGADSKFDFILEKMSKDDFKDKYPKATVPGDNLKVGKGLGQELWYDKDTVTIAEYLVRETEESTLYLMEDGTVLDEDELKEAQSEWDQQNAEMTHKIDSIDPMQLIQKLQQPQPQQPPKPSVAPGGGPILGQPKPNMPPTGQPAPGGQPPMGAQGMGGGQPPPPGQPPQPQQPPQPPPDTRIPQTKRPEYKDKRTYEKNRIRQYILTCEEILDGPNDIPGDYIPVVMVYGKERNIEGKRYVRGLVQDAMDPQKMVNFWNSSAAETIALAPKAPWTMTPKQLEGHEDTYAQANIDNSPFVLYNPDPEAPGPPMRNQPGAPPVAIFEQIQRGEENIKSVIGMFNADTGAPDSRQTGAAVTAGQRPGDIGTFAFLDNLNRSVAYSGRIINSMIPYIYDTERDVRIRNFDDSESFVPVNTTAGEALRRVTQNPERYVGLDKKKLENTIRQYGKDTKFNELTIGKYDVVCTAGPSYATQRTESAQHMLQLAQAMPQQMAIALDLLVKNMDFKDADVVSRRIRKTLPPHLLEPVEGETPPQAPPPPPAVQIQMMKLQIEQQKLQLQVLKGKQEEMKLQHEQLKIQLELAKHGTKQGEQGQQQDKPTPMDHAAIIEKMEKLKIEQRKLDLEAAKLNHQIMMDHGKHGLEHSKHQHSMNLDWAQHAQEGDKLSHDMASQPMDSE